MSGKCPTRERGRLFSSELDFKPEEAATQSRQKEQQGAAFKTAYRIRSGIEASNSTLKGPMGADDIRVRGQARVRVSMLLKSLALNARRCVNHHLSELRAAPSEACEVAVAV